MSDNQNGYTRGKKKCKAQVFGSPLKKTAVYHVYTDPLFAYQ